MNAIPDAIARSPASAARGGLHELPQAEAWRWLATAPDEEIPLSWAALVLARDEYPDLDLPAYAAAMADLARPVVGSADADPLDTMRAINRVLYDERGFSGNQADFYDPRNSYLNEVIDRRLGIPITLALLQMDIASRVGLPLKGVSFPGHFLVSLPLDEGLLVLDPSTAAARSTSTNSRPGRSRTWPMANSGRTRSPSCCLRPRTARSSRACCAT